MRKIKTNDNVIVIKGKDAGKKGKVQKILPDKGKLLIEGINIYKKHMKTQLVLTILIFTKIHLKKSHFKNALRISLFE